MGFGGSHAINAMVYIRGHPFDYNLWSYFTKDDRWKYENLLPFFQRSEGLCENGCEQPAKIKPTVERNEQRNYAVYFNFFTLKIEGFEKINF